MKRTKVFPALAMFATTFCVSGAAQNAGAPSEGTAVLVEGNGVKLTLNDLEQKRASAMFQAKTTYYETERKVIEDLVDQSILEQQASKEGLTVTQLLDLHVNSTIAKDPSDEAVRVYYEGVDTTQPYEAVRDKIVESLRQRRIAKAKTAYMQSLHSQNPMVIRLAPPRAPISMQDVAVRGDGKPGVTLLEFADFQCPYCQQIQPVLQKIEEEFKGKLAFAYKDYPLPMHGDAEKAAEASHCAGAQGKYWEYHDTMFADKQLDLPSLKNYARDLKLDTKAFETCLDTGQMAGVVGIQNAEAQTLGLQGTPSFFLNGRYVSGNVTYERLRSVIAEELSAVEPQAETATLNSNGAKHDAH
jgi:protein-disulfide isomerase